MRKETCVTDFALHNFTLKNETVMFVGQKKKRRKNLFFFFFSFLSDDILNGKSSKELCVLENARCFGQFDFYHSLTHDHFPSSFLHSFFSWNFTPKEVAFVKNEKNKLSAILCIHTHSLFDPHSHINAKTILPFFFLS